MKRLGQNNDPFIPLVIGTQTAATNQFTGVLPLDQLKHGQSIRYWLPHAGKSTGNTLNLTLRGGSTTGEIQLYYKGSTKLTTQFSAGSLIMLTYLENANVGGVTYTGWWADGAVQSASGGSSSADHTHTWEDVANVQVLEDLVITSDDVNYGGYHKVSDEVPTIEQVRKGGTVSFNEGGNGIVTMNYPEGDITVMTLGSTNGAGIVYNGLTLAAVAFEDGATVLGTTLDEKGIYFVQNDTVITHSLTISEYTPVTEVVPIPYEFLPESHQFYEKTASTDVLTWDGSMDGSIAMGDGSYFVKLADTIPTLEDLANGGTVVVKLSGSETTIEFTSYVDLTGEGVPYWIATNDSWEDDMSMCCPMIFHADYSENGLTATKGIYAYYIADTIVPVSFTINGYTFDLTKIKKLKGKYLEPFNYVEGSETVSIDLEYGFVANQICKLTDEVLTASELAQAVITVENGNGTQTITLNTDTISSEGSLTFGSFTYPLGFSDGTTTYILISSLTASSDLGAVELPSAGTYIYTFITGDETATKVSLTIEGKKMGESLKLKAECLPNQEEVYVKPTIIYMDWAGKLYVNGTATSSDDTFGFSLYESAGKGGFRLDTPVVVTNADGTNTQIDLVMVDVVPVYNGHIPAYVATNLIVANNIPMCLYTTVTETETTFKLMELAQTTSFLSSEGVAF